MVVRRRGAENQDKLWVGGWQVLLGGITRRMCLCLDVLCVAGMKNRKVFRLPFVDDGTDAVEDKVRTHLLCKRGLYCLLTFGQTRYVNIRRAAMSSAVLPDHKSIGKKNYNNVEKNERKYQPVLHHFDYLKNLGEIRATRAVATLVDGMGGHVNRDDNIDDNEGEDDQRPGDDGFYRCAKN